MNDATPLSEAIDMYRPEMLRQNWRPTTRRRYAAELMRFAKHVEDVPVGSVTVWTCREFLDTFNHLKLSTRQIEFGILKGFFEWLVDEDVIDSHPMAKMKRPRGSKNREVTRISTEQLTALLDAARTPAEILCLNVFAYTGGRRSSVNELRWRDVDFHAGTVTFRFAKGDKPYTLPLVDELRRVLIRHGVMGSQVAPDDWVVPNRRPLGHTRERCDRHLWHTVRGVAKRCGIDSHCHALRAAFACGFLAANPDQMEACRALLNHSSVATTQMYLDAIDEQKMMQPVTSLSFAPASSLPQDLADVIAGQSRVVERELSHAG